MFAEISLYNVVLFIHIAAVVLAFGVTFSYPLVLSVTRKGFERQLPYLHQAAGGAYFGPREKRLSELAERDVAASPEGPVSFSAEYDMLFRQMRTVTLVANVLVLLAIFLMVTKP